MLKVQSVCEKNFDVDTGRLELDDMNLSALCNNEFMYRK